LERRLAAILSADLVGYSRLMGTDEAGTLQRFTALRHELLEPLIAEHGGRVVKLLGDGLLVEFASAVNALACAVAWQNAVAEHEATAPEDRRFSFRIGINLGDIIAEGGDIHGDGVNLAARIETQAEPGGICVSQDIHRQSKGKVPVAFEDLGEHSLKNIAEPVRLFRALHSGAERVNASAPLPEMPSIAALPFENMSGDAEQAYLADGIAEDILTGLARVRWLVVTSRNSSFAYRGQNTDLKRVARELGVRYVLEGSVRRAGERVRVTAQLIDAAEDRHIWAERYDRRIADIFDLQDEITATILGAIEPELGLAEQARARRKPPESLDAWDLYLQGQWHQFRYTAVDNLKAQDCFRRAIEIDPEFAASHAGLAYACHHATIEDFSDDPAARISEGVKAARPAVALDEKGAHAYAVLARILAMNGEHDAALMAGEKAVGLNPNNAQVRFGNGQVLTYAGRSEEALSELDAATRLSPRDPNLWAFMIVRAWAMGSLERDEEAAEWARRAAEQPNAMLWPNITLVAALGHLGRQDEARAACARFREENPEKDLLAICDILPFRDPAHRARLAEGVRKAGVLEGDLNDPNGSHFREGGV
jgi:adenylate cyclase